jgi:neutral ceramidase
MNWENPDVVRAAGPIDPEIGLLALYPLAALTPPENSPPDGAKEPPSSRNTSAAQPTAILSNFALHLDTVGGSRWSADYPYFIEQTLRQSFGPDLVSIFGTGCCGDINHVDPRSRERNKADFIGGSIGESIQGIVAEMKPIEHPRLSVKSDVVHLPLQEAAEEEVVRSIQLLQAAKRGERIEFFDHVTAYKKLILDQLRHPEPHATTSEHITWGLSRSLAGIGESLPTDVTVIAVGGEVAIVCLPGEVFVDLGLAIKQASPFQTTLVVELANQVETIYIPHRGAYAGGSYEVTNSTLEPGSGEVLVESAIRLLREAATSLNK